jgi:hypothetical protein
MGSNSSPDNQRNQRGQSLSQMSGGIFQIKSVTNLAEGIFSDVPTKNWSFSDDSNPSDSIDYFYYWWYGGKDAGGVTYNQIKACEQ